MGEGIAEQALAAEKGEAAHDAADGTPSSARAEQHVLRAVKDVEELEHGVSRRSGRSMRLALGAVGIDGAGP